jgi:hypothetical protein
MITRRGLAEQLISVLYPNTTSDKKLHLQEAELAISQARDAYIRNLILQNKVETNIVNGNLLSSYDNVSIAYNEARCEYYCYLPVRVISLPNDLGLYRVMLCGDNKKDIVITSSGFNSMYKNSLAKNSGGDLTGFIIQNKFVFNQPMDGQKVSFDLVAMSEDIGSNEYFPLGGEGQMEVLAMALEIYKIQKGIPEDIKSDGISD